ncbi:MAG: hypothetical protein IKI88_02040 [Anaerotignum sp.]|nr:hypothetical protein [Anaerotignum sp.]
MKRIEPEGFLLSMGCRKKMDTEMQAQIKKGRIHRGGKRSETGIRAGRINGKRKQGVLCMRYSLFV